MYIPAVILLLFSTFSYTESTYTAHISFEQYVNENGTTVRHLPRAFEISFEDKSELISIVKTEQVEFALQCELNDTDGPFISLGWSLFEKTEGKWKKVSRKVSSDDVLLNRPFHFSIPLKERTSGLSSLELELILTK